jgi:hypothetical protein
MTLWEGCSHLTRSALSSKKIETASNGGLDPLPLDRTQLQSITGTPAASGWLHRAPEQPEAAGATCATAIGCIAGCRLGAA